jgi:hypothetical protein
VRTLLCGRIAAHFTAEYERLLREAPEAILAFYRDRMGAAAPRENDPGFLIAEMRGFTSGTRRRQPRHR